MGSGRNPGQHHPGIGIPGVVPGSCPASVEGGTKPGHILSRLAFRIDGVAVPQGSKRLGRAGRSGRPLIVEDNPNLRAWRDSITLQARSAARRAGWTTPARDVAVDVHLYVGLPRPASAPRARVHPVCRPDIDKLGRALLDGLVDAAVLTDDSQVTRLEVVKVYSDNPGVDVRVSFMKEEPTPRLRRPAEASDPFAGVAR